MKKRILAALLASVAMTSLVACNNASTDDSAATGDSATTDTATGDDADAADLTLRLAWCSDGNNKEFLDECLYGYTENTGIAVESLCIPGTWAEYLTKISTMVAGGDTVDNAWVAIEGVANFIDLGLGTPLNDYEAAHQEEFDVVANDIDPAILDALTVDDQLYALAWDWNNVCMHINTACLEEAGLTLPEKGWNTEDFLSYCEALTNEDGDLKQYAVSIPSDNYFCMTGWLYANGASVLNDDMTEATINAPESVEVFQMCQDLIYKYGYAPIPEKNVNVTQQCMDGNIVMYSAGRWPTFTYVTEECNDIAVQYLPEFEEGNDTVCGGQGGIFVLNGTEHYEEAAGLSLYIASEAFVGQYSSTSSIPALKSLAEEIIVEGTVPANGENVFYPSISTMKSVQAPTAYPQIEDVFNRASSEIFVNQADVQSTLDAAAAEINSLLS